MSAIGCICEMDNQHVLRQIISRLPVIMQNKWRVVADNTGQQSFLRNVFIIRL